MAGQNADMTLKVGLDLNFFRQELQKASSTLAGQPIDINVRFNRSKITNELRLLSNSLGRKKYDVEVKSTSLEALLKQVNTFKQTLKNLKDEKIELSINASANIEKFSKEKIRKIRAQIRRDIVSGGAGEIQLPTKLATPNVAAFVKGLAKQAQVTVAIKNGATGKEVRSVLDAIESRIQSDQKIKQGSGKLRVPTSIKASINNADVSSFKKAVNEKLGSIAIKIKAGVDIAKTPAQIQAEVARKMEDIARIGAERMAGGGVTESARREQFRTAITGEGIGSLKNIAKQVGVGGYSKYKSDTAAELINKLVQEASIEAITRYLDPQAVMRNPDRSGLNKVLDTFARGLFQMLGMDPATIRREMQQRRALPGVNFPSTIPPRNIPIGPSETGRALPPGAIPSALPGTSFGGQKYLPTALSDELKKILRGAAFAFVDSLKQQVRGVRMGLGATQQPLLGPSRIAGLLPAGVGRAPSVYSTGAVGGETRAEMMARREREARMRSDLRGIDVIGGGAGRIPSPYSYAYRGARPTSAIVPYAAGGAIVPQPAMASGAGGGMQPPAGGGGFGGFGGAGGFGGFGRAMGGINLPGAGAIRELGDEFGFATKQVLLFGQAYKLLAFVQNFPGQVATAVSELQSFRNTLLSVTGSASAAADANEFILAAVEKYSIPLQSARDGFTKLFASMEPAGFAAGEIQNLFLGISKAAATYGLSADKVDRVNYAFAQMASKGQVMSEELKGQLGDVLPGAMGIFAEAAGFKGPDAIQKFGKALEDGVYKGGKMRELLRNVALGMNKEFGPGAEGAAKTFQGAINRMQTATQKLYESFEPAAIGVLNTVAVPLVNTLKNLTDGVNAYFSGQQAATPAAQDFANALKTLVPTLSGIGENLKYVFQQVSVLVQGFGAVTLQASRLLALPIVGYLAGTYVQVLLLTTAYKALAASGIGAAIVAITRFIAQGVVYAQVTLGMRVATQQTTVAMYQFGTAVQTVMIKSVIGIALVAIGALISRFVELQNAMASVSGQAKGMQDAAKASAKLGDVAGVKEAIGNMNARVETYKNIKNQLDSVIKKDQAGSSFYREIPSALASQLMATGLIVENSMRKVGAGYKVKIGDLRDAYALAEKQVSVFNKTIGQSEGLIGQAQKQSQKLKEQGGLGLEAGAPDEKALRAQQKAAEEARKLADDKRKYEADLMKLSSQQAIDLNEMEFDQWKNLQQAKYDFLEAGQNDWMSREIKFQRDLQAIEIRRIEAIRRARIETVKAETEAQSRAYVAGGAGIGATTGLMQGSTGISSGPHFDVRRADGSRISEAEARALFDPAVRRQLQMTSGYGPRNTGIPGASTFHRGIDLAGPANTPLNLAAGYSMQSAGMEGGLGYTANVRGPQGQMYKVGHLQEPKSGMPASRVRAEAKKDYSAALASQEAINAKEKENAQIKYANIQAQQELNVLIREYTASIVPIEQQRLENTLLQNRIDLMTSGLFGEALDTEQKISETREKAALGVQMANDAIAANNKLVKDGILTQEQADRLNASNVEKIKQLTEGLQNYIPLLRERLKLEQSSAEASLMGQIRQESPLGGMGLSAGFIGPAADKYVEAIGRGAPEEEASRFAELQNQLTLLETRNEAIKQSIYGIGDAFGEAMTTGVTGLISGTATAKEVFASFLQSVGQALSQAASQMIATYIAIGIAKMFAGLGGGGNPAGSGGGISNILPGASQYMEGGGAALGASAGTFGAVTTGYANGGIVPGGFRAFANGGVVSGPTLGLVGEGRYNEAVVPLPNGRAIPVQINGGRSARDLMGSNAPGMANAAPLTLKFESTKINGVEYVSREQLELAMAETRRASIAGGATRGMNMALDKIQQSPSTRSRIGIR
jgi:tape measure domain-containing protein